jgi:U3 small nucleolar RNA-associated protein 4
VIVPLKEMGRENHRTISTLPQQPPITSAHKARFIVSWWEREVHLWILRKPAGELFDSGVENSDINENRKLLKTIVIKGDANIASATIDPAGTLLVVSTAIDVKAFRLEHEDPSKPSDVKLFSAELPQKLTKLGASHVQLSPDKRWLCTIQEGARVLVAAIDAAVDGADVTFLPQNIYKLPRLRHHLPRYVKNGGMGSYDRTITHVAFSADSKMLATADLAGHVDSWVLQSRENLPQNGEEADLSSIEESDSSEDEEEDEADSTTKEHWARNPNGKLLPKLPSAPVVLSFSEDVPGDSSGNNDYTLLVVTSNWNLVAFRPLQGSLTQWSRRNTRKSLPPPILDLLDLAKGAVWQGQRVWIYGVSFLIMIDMSQDLPKLTQEPDAPAEQAGLKRKRKGHHTGAGGKMKLGNLRPHQIHKHGEGEDEDVIMEEGEPEADSNSDEDDDDDADGPADELAQLRNASHGDVTGGMDLAVNGAHRKSWWMTYKYRPIFGIVSLGDDIEAAEVALVERPTWNVDMAARYFGGAEWER